MQWCKPKRISTGFPIVKISFFFSWFIALSLAHWDASAIRPITFGTVPARLVHCTAPEPLALLIHGTLSSLHQGLAVPLYYLLSFSSVLPLKQGNTPNVCHSDDSKPLFPCSCFPPLFFTYSQGKCTYQSCRFHLPRDVKSCFLSSFPILMLLIHIEQKLLHVCNHIFVPVPTKIFIYFSTP